MLSKTHEPTRWLVLLFDNFNIQITYEKAGDDQPDRSISSHLPFLFGLQQLPRAATDFHSRTIMAEPMGLIVVFTAMLDIFAFGWKSLRTDGQDFGVVPAVALRLGLFDARGVVNEVREHFITVDGGLDQVMAFKDSHTPTFDMVGVAGAIFAQIALTGLGLPNLDDTHWTARASFVLGLVAGSLAVFCTWSCKARCLLYTTRTPCEVG